MFGFPIPSVIYIFFFKSLKCLNEKGKVMFAGFKLNVCQLLQRGIKGISPWEFLVGFPRES